MRIGWELFLEHCESVFAQVTESCVVMAALGIVVVRNDCDIQSDFAQDIETFKPRGIVAHFVNLVHRDCVAPKS